MRLNQYQSLKATETLQQKFIDDLQQQLKTWNMDENQHQRQLNKQSKLVNERKLQDQKIQDQVQLISKEKRTIEMLQNKLMSIGLKIEESSLSRPIINAVESIGTGHIQLKQSKDLANHYALQIAKLMTSIDALYLAIQSQEQHIQQLKN